MKPSRLSAALALVALLAACKGEAPQEGEVAGEVLEGTISDQMLPLDQARSEAPLADPTAAARDNAAEPGSAAEAEVEAPAEPEATAEPADAEE